MRAGAAGELGGKAEGREGVVVVEEGEAVAFMAEGGVRSRGDRVGWGRWIRRRGLSVVLRDCFIP